jgi:hypothetical protein
MLWLLGGVCRELLFSSLSLKKLDRSEINAFFILVELVSDLGESAKLPKRSWFCSCCGRGGGQKDGGSGAVGTTLDGELLVLLDEEFGLLIALSLAFKKLPLLASFSGEKKFSSSDALPISTNVSGA